MNFLIIGGAGSVGRDLTASLMEQGHRVRILDKHADASGGLHGENVEWIQGRLEDPQLVVERFRAWMSSFTWHGLFPKIP